jgi:hypothetical protein
LGHEQILTPFRVCLDSRPVALVGGEAVERDQPPRHVVRAFIGKKIPDQVSAAPGDDASPALGVRLECVALERIDLIADEAGNRH